ncbi:MAG TPA: GntR family transcriptional regulator [Candidatus Cybelea sp.]|jgi:DNA-binding GntR family transcriptional regulator|nr:GntR family transcriptional regulator [Candidatus Cybelea sp.]
MPAVNGGRQIRGTADQIADRVRAEIESGALAPGSPLNQMELAERFGLSRIPIREALRGLEAEGYLDYRPNKGAVVSARPNTDEVREIVEIRECLEERIMRHAVAAMSDAVLARAGEALKAMNRAADETQVRGAHERFHKLLFDAANRPRTAQVIGAWRFHYHLDKQKAFIRASREVHARLLHCCASGDVDGVAHCVRDEYEIVRATIPSALGQILH